MRKLMLRISAALVPFFFLFLSGCHKPVLTPVEVLLPIGTPCPVSMPVAPAWPTSIVAADAGMVARVMALAAENELRKGYEAELMAALKACVKP